MTVTRRGVVLGIVGGLLARPAAAAVPYQETFEAAAAAYGIDPDWLIAVARCESGFVADAVNPRTGDSGIFQWSYATWIEFGGDPALYMDPVAQIWLAAWAFANGYSGRWCCDAAWAGGFCQ